MSGWTWFVTGLVIAGCAVLTMLIVNIIFAVRKRQVRKEIEQEYKQTR